MFALSSQGLTNLQAVATSEVFTIIVGKKKYPMPKFIAAFISPVIAKLLQDQPNAVSFKINVNDEDNSFRSIIQLGYGQMIQIDPTQRKTIQQIAMALGNDEIVAACDKANKANVSKKKFTPANICKIIQTKKEMFMNISKDVQYAAAHFYEINQDELAGLDYDILNAILSQSGLVVQTETNLFNFILRLVKERGARFGNLFGYVLFEYIAEEEMTDFVSLYSGNQLNESVWAAVSRRLVLPIKPVMDMDERHKAVPPRTKSNRSSRVQSRSQSPGLSEKSAVVEKSDKVPEEDDKESVKSVSKSPKVPIRTILPEGDDPFHGIFHRLRSNRLAVSMTASSCNTGTLVSLINPTNKTNYWTQNQPDSWIRVDLKKNRVNPVAYTIRGRMDHDYNQLQSWVFEGLNRGRWVTIDKHQNEPLRIKEAKTFQVEAKGTYNAFRIKQIGENTYGDNDLVLSAFEVFGHIY